jgi:hypothetical protein
MNMTHNPEADRQEALYEQAQEDGAAFMKLMEYLRGYARYDLDEIASEQSRYFLEDLEMCLHYIRKGEWTDREAVHTMGQHALAWLESMLLQGTDAYIGGARDETNVAAGIVDYFTTHAPEIEVYTECPNCDGFVGPRGCMDCNDPTGEHAREDERMEQYKDMKNW